MADVGNQSFSKALLGNLCWYSQALQVSVSRVQCNQLKVTRNNVLNLIWHCIRKPGHNTSQLPKAHLNRIKELKQNCLMKCVPRSCLPQNDGRQVKGCYSA